MIRPIRRLHLWLVLVTAATVVVATTAFARHEITRASPNSIPTPLPTPVPLPSPLPTLPELPDQDETCTRTLFGKQTVPTLTVPAGQVWCFDPATTTTVESLGNVIVRGTLRIRPANASVTHTLRFIGADERRFVGGGTDPLETDDGLWVVDQGRLDVAGAPKLAWARAASGLEKRDTSVPLDALPAGWRVGDEIAIAPTARGDYSNFEVRKVTSISGNVVRLDSGLNSGHPSVSFAGKTYGPEVFNLTRNVRIEGTEPQFEYPRAGQNNSRGRAHVFIRSTSPQDVRYAAVRNMGPRQASRECWIGNDCSAPVLGRYGLHFHMVGDDSRGSIIEGTVVRDTGNHAFVAHASHGITFKDTVAFNTNEDAYWWDFPRLNKQRKCAEAHCADGSSDDVVYERAAAAFVKTDPLQRGTRLTGFAAQHGNGNAIRDSVAVGVQTDIDSSGFGWLEGTSHSVWHFENNVAHNNKVEGIFWWQVDDPLHVVENFVSYRNGVAGVDHGAYLNNVHYLGWRSFQDGAEEAPLVLIAGAMNDAPGLVFKDVTIDGGGESSSALLIREKVTGPGGRTKLVRFWVSGYTGKAITVDERHTGGNDSASRIDMICWSVGTGARDLEPADFHIVNWDPHAEIRVQRKDGSAFTLSGGRGKAKSIPPFATC